MSILDFGAAARVFYGGEEILEAHFRGDRLWPWSPDPLFANSEPGVWLAPSDLATLFTDVAGTTQAQIGDPVADRKDKSGNNGSIPQATSANRPTYVDVEGKGALLYNGTNQVLLHDLGGATSGLRAIETPWGHQIDNGVLLSGTRTPMLLESQFIARQGVVPPATVDRLSRLMNGNREYFVCQTYNINLQSLQMNMSNSETPILRCIGYNGVETTITLGDDSHSPVGLAAAGLTAPFSILFPLQDAPAALTHFRSPFNQFTGSIPDLSQNTALIFFFCNNNLLTGSIPDLSNNTALDQFRVQNNQLTGSIPDLTQNTALTIFWCHNNQLTGNIPDLSNNTALTNFSCDRNQLTGWDGGTLPASLSNFFVGENALPQATVDALLVSLDTAGTSDRWCSLEGGTNAAPSATGEAAIINLRSRGWTVSVTGGF